MKIAVEQSEDSQEENARAEFINQFRAKYCEDLPDAAILFCSINYDHKNIFSSINDVFPGIELIGGTTNCLPMLALAIRRKAL